MQRKPRLLLSGVLISSFIYDVLYIVIGGIVGTTVKLDSPYMILIFIGGLTVLYVMMFLVRYVRKYISKRKYGTDGAGHNGENGEAVAGH